MTKKILAVIPTFNRADLVEITSGYLKRIPFDPNTFSFLISDDCSTDYDLAFLEGAYSTLPNVTFMKTSKNSGAAAHMRLLLRFFLNKDLDKILILDSDLIVHECSIQCINAFDDELVSSLYNSCFHEIDRQYDSYCTKADIGWAGALIDKRIIREMFQLFGSSPFDDWALCAFAKRQNLTIKVSTPSAIEHIGVSGSNNAVPEYFDHSLDFPKEYIDKTTCDFFLDRRGVDLLHYLETKPERYGRADSLSVFYVAPPAKTK